MGKVRAQQGFFTIERTCPNCQGGLPHNEFPQTCDECGFEVEVFLTREDAAEAIYRLENDCDAMSALSFSWISRRRPTIRLISRTKSRPSPSTLMHPRGTAFFVEIPGRPSAPSVSAREKICFYGTVFQSARC